jgi:hypothetical protein
MRHDPRLLSLYAKQLQERQRREAGWPAPNDYREILFSCFAVVLIVAGFFWAYGAITHREVPYVLAIDADQSLVRDAGLAAQVPAPDMNSPAVALANEDVPEALRSTAAAASEIKTVAEIAPAKKRKPHVVRRPLPDVAAQAYAAVPDFFHMAHGPF